MKYNIQVILWMSACYGKKNFPSEGRSMILLQTSSSTDHEHADDQGGGERKYTATNPRASRSSSSSTPPHLLSSLPRLPAQRQSSGFATITSLSFTPEEKVGTPPPQPGDTAPARGAAAEADGGCRRRGERGGKNIRCGGD